MKPRAHVAAAQSLASVQLHDVHASTDGSDEKSSQQKPSSAMKPGAQIAKLQSCISGPVQLLHEVTDQ